MVDATIINAERPDQDIPDNAPGLCKPDGWAARRAQMGELMEAQVEIESLYYLVQNGIVRAGGPPTLDLIHRLAKRLEKAANEAHSGLVHLARDGRWMESERRGCMEAHADMLEEWPDCPNCKSGLADVGAKLVCPFCEHEQEKEKQDAPDLCECGRPKPLPSAGRCDCGEPVSRQAEIKEATL